MTLTAESESTADTSICIADIKETEDLGSAITPRNGDKAVEVITQELTLNNNKPKGLIVSFKELKYTVYKRKTLGLRRGEPIQLLHGITGFFKPGQLAALMGPSGSGKTTLLDVLAGRKTQGKIEGDILYGIEPPTKAFLKRHTGYVEQFDTLVENLSVFEMLLYTAELKLPLSLDMKEKKRRVEDLINYMDLTKARDTRIGGVTKRGISGGQAKRVNIGVSIITDPHVLFLDEPTSGLDSFTSEEVMHAVRKVALDGVTVCATIHSPTPSIFALFDRLILLAGGKMAYFGQLADSMIQYFHEHGLDKDTPYTHGRDAEWVVELITGADKSGRIDDFALTYKSSALYQTNLELQKGGEELIRRASTMGIMVNLQQLDPIAPRQKDKVTAVPMYYAVRVMLYYRVLRNYQDGMFLSARLVDKLIACSIMVSLFANMGRQNNIRAYNNVAAALFMWATQPSFSAAAYIPTIMLERPLYQRELNDGMYRPETYYVVKWIQELCLLLPASLLFSGFIWLSIHLVGDFGVFWIAFMMCQVVAVATAFTFAGICPTLEFANGALPSFGFTLLFFVGFLVPIDQIPSWWIWYSYFPCYLRYPFLAMMVNQFGNQTVPYNETMGSHGGGGGGSVTPNDISNSTGNIFMLTYYGIEDELIWTNLLALALYAGFFMFAAGAVLMIIKYGAR